MSIVSSHGGWGNVSSMIKSFIERERVAPNKPRKQSSKFKQIYHTNYFDGQTVGSQNSGEGGEREGDSENARCTIAAASGARIKSSVDGNAEKAGSVGRCPRAPPRSRWREGVR